MGKAHAPIGIISHRQAQIQPPIPLSQRLIRSLPACRAAPLGRRDTSAAVLVHRHLDAVTLLVRVPVFASNSWYSILRRFWYSHSRASTRTF